MTVGVRHESDRNRLRLFRRQERIATRGEPHALVAAAREPVVVTASR